MEGHKQTMSGAGAPAGGSVGGFKLHDEDVHEYAGPSSQPRPDAAQGRHERQAFVSHSGQHLSGAGGVVGASAGGWNLHDGNAQFDYAGPSTQARADPARHERTASLDGFNEVVTRAYNTDHRITWDWLVERGQGQMISSDIAARSRMEGDVRVLYFGRNNRFGGFTNLRMSMFQALRLRELIDKILEEIAIYGEYENNKLLPLLSGDYSGAFKGPGKKNVDAFWRDAHLDIGSIKARLSFDCGKGCYLLRVLSPVEGAEEKYQGSWLGPVFAFNAKEMQKLRAFITATRHVDA